SRDRDAPARLQERVARMSLRARVSALAALGVGLAVLLTSLAAYATVRNQLLQQRDEALLERAGAMIEAGFVSAELIDGLPPATFGAGDVRIALLGANGRLRTAQGVRDLPLVGADELRVARGLASDSIRSVVVDEVEYRVVAVPAGPGLALVFAQPTAPTQDLLDRLGLVLLVVGGAGVLLAAYAGLVIARAGLRPVERLTAAAEHVAATGRPDPIDVPADRTDEIGRLAHSFNAMLEALAEAQDRQRRLVADAGHELRTPLTSLRTNLDLLAQADREGGLDPVEHTALIRDVRAQLEELGTLVADLVELSREDPSEGTREDLDLAETVAEAVARVRRRAPGLDFQVRTDPWPVHGDPQLLSRAVTNLLDNAAKWSPPGGAVRVTLHDGTLEICDQGPGIAETDLPHVFERFYRSPEARALPGSGLGLAIVRSAAERHEGAVRADRAPGGGARLRFWIPSSSVSLN
ncbi:MAG TPA: HAMP domain-containing sensor histidine kinase, partial [Jiangellales bacterium]|nr:HAMP domain-containing sensor histidine kinase [Jiangellales bacterium]